jgi:LPXTG-motif cell wall-anchored protein
VARVTRLAGITTLYALIAALVLVTPLSASEEPATEPGPGQTAAAPDGGPPTGTTREVAPPRATPPDAAPPEATAAPQQTAPAPAPAGPASGETASGETASSEAVAGETAPGETASGEPAPGEAAPGGPAPAGAPATGEPAASAPAADDGAAPASAERKRRRSGRAPVATAAADTSVTISDFQFAPASVTIDVGDTVTWNNEGPTAHSATADDGEFDTGIFDAGQSRSHTFDQAGTYSYFCTPHPNMEGTVTVRAASSGGQARGDVDDTVTPADTDDSGAAESDTSDDSSDAALPATGRDTGGLAVLGLMTLALGVWLRRRSAASG